VRWEDFVARQVSKPHGKGAMPTANTRSLRLPDFIGVGPPRTGTSWLHEALSGHLGLPDRVKETNFFVWNYGRGLEWYASQFRRCPPGVPMGEFGPMYFIAPETRERIARHIPGCKIICTFRDPVERTYSHYKNMLKGGYFSGSFEECIEKRLDVLEWSRYATYLEAWRQPFGEENVFVAIHDDLKANPQIFLDQVCDFLQIPRIPLAGSRLSSSKVNGISVRPRNLHLARATRIADEFLQRLRLQVPVDFLIGAGVRNLLYSGGRAFEPVRPETAARLREIFRPEVEKLEEMLGRDLSSWKSRSAGLTSSHGVCFPAGSYPDPEPGRNT
jgi:hypothetical protein